MDSMVAKGGIQEVSDPRLDSERKLVACTRVRHVVGNGVEMSRDPEGVPVALMQKSSIWITISWILDVLDPPEYARYRLR